MKVEIRKVVHKNVNKNSFLQLVHLHGCLTINSWKYFHVIKEKKERLVTCFHFLLFQDYYIAKKVSLRVVITQPFSKTLYH